MNQSADIFCPLPWISYAVRNDGKVRVCCHANQGKENGILYRDRNVITYRDEIDTSRNCDKLKSIRLSFLNNKWHPECIRCQKEYEIGLRSRNVYESDVWKEYITKEQAKEQTSKDGSIKTKKIPLRYFDLRFGNLCNLKCRMCGSSDSNAWYTEQYEVLNNHYINGKEYELIQEDDQIKIKDDPFSWYDEDSFWEELESQIPTMTFCYMVGGEPLLIKKHYDFLNKCISSGRSKEITIEYNTNLTFLPSHAFPLWKKFKKIRFGVSLDGVGRVNDYIRHPSKFQKIEDNLSIIDKLDDNVDLWLSCTVMIYNMIHLPDYIKWKIDKSFNKMKPHNKRMILTSHPLHTPHFLNIKMFPEKSKRIIENIFEEKIETFKNLNYDELVKNKFEKILGDYIKYMNQEDYSHEIPRFFEYNDRIDKHRNQKLDDYIPGLRELLEYE